MKNIDCVIKIVFQSPGRSLPVLCPVVASVIQHGPVEPTGA